jgi:hypothetical protein
MTNQESRFENAIELATKLDTAYDRVQSLCGRAMRKSKGAEDAARELLAYLDGELSELGSKFYSASCSR